MRDDIKALGTVDQYRLPSPFPGQHPTRIRWRLECVRNIQGRQIVTYKEYAGKPSPIAIRRMLKLIRRDSSIRHVDYWEFDRVSLIVHLRSATPRLGGGVAYENFMVYHPWSSMVHGWEWILTNWWIKRIKTNKRTWPVYSPTEKLETNTHLTPFKNYMNGRSL